MRNDLADSIRFVLSNRPVRSTAAYTALATGFTASTLAILPLYATGLGLTPASYGLAVGATGFGGIIGAVLVGTEALKWDRRRLGLGSAAVIVAAQWLLPAASAASELALLILAASQFMAGGALAVYTAIVLSVQQDNTPESLRGRMFASVRFARFGSGAIGAIMGGLLGQAVGLAPVTLLAAVGATLSLFWLAPRAAWGTAGTREGGVS